MSCGRILADFQWWTFCGETDMGQTMPALCVECDPPLGYLLSGATALEVTDADARRKAVFERWEAAGFVGDLNDYTAQQSESG